MSGFFFRKNVRKIKIKIEPFVKMSENGYKMLQNSALYRNVREWILKCQKIDPREKISEHGSKISYFKIVIIVMLCSA